MSCCPLLDDAIAILEEKDQPSVLVLADIARERVRQIEEEGWSPTHDDNHVDGEMSAAAACYALAAHHPASNATPYQWPWAPEWWKPKNLHRNRIRAGALLVAELARHLRSAPHGAG